MSYGGYEGAGYEFAETEGPTPIPPVQSETPDLLIQIDFVNDVAPELDVLPEPVWSDVSAYLREGGATIKRGRERAIDRNEAGNATVLFDDFDRAFDPENTEGPFFPGVVPMRRLRISSVHVRASTAFAMASSEVGGPDLVGGGDTLTRYVLFDGMIEAWTYDYPLKGLDATATARCVDMFGALSREKVTIKIKELADQTAADHIDRVLNTRAYTGRVAGAGAIDPLTEAVTSLPSPMRDVSRKAGLLMAPTLLDEFTDVGLLETLATLAASEGGNFFISREGRPTYRDRRWSERPTDEGLRFAVDSERFVDVTRQYDETLIFNRCTVTGPFGTVVLSDAPSIARYFQRDFAVDTYLADTATATIRAQEILLHHHHPRIALTRLDLSNVVADWEAILRRELWDTVIIDIPLPNGDVVSQRSQIEGIQIHTPTRRFLDVLWWLSEPSFPNLLSDAASSFEGSVGGWMPETNCTLSSTTTETWHSVQRPIHPPDGVAALLLAAVADGPMSALSPTVPVDGRRSYVVAIQARQDIGSGTSSSQQTKDTTVEVDWLDAGSSVLSSLPSAVTTISKGGVKWRAITVEGRAPSAAVFARVRLAVEDAELSRQFFADAVSFTRAS